MVVVHCGKYRREFYPPSPSPWNELYPAEFFHLSSRRPTRFWLGSEHWNEDLFQDWTKKKGMHITTNELDVYLVIGLRGRGRGWFIHSFLFVIGSDKKGGRWFDSCNIFVGRKLCRSGIETNEIESCAARVDTMAAACPKSDKKWKKKKSNRKRRIERREERDQVCWL